MVFMKLMVPSKHELSASDAAQEATAPQVSSASQLPATPDEGPPVAGADPAAILGNLHQALRNAADAAHRLGMPLDELMQLSWSTFVDARPGLREHLAEAQLAQQIHELRAQGRVGQA